MPFRVQKASRFAAQHRFPSWLSAVRRGDLWTKSLAASLRKTKRACVNLGAPPSMVFRETARQDARERRVAHRFADPQHHAQYNDHREWMPVDRPSVVVVACTARFSYRQPRPLWTFDERQPPRRERVIWLSICRFQHTRLSATGPIKLEMLPLYTGSPGVSPDERTLWQTRKRRLKSARWTMRNRLKKQPRRRLHLRKPRPGPRLG